jgi:multicomponent K+:H+ antiporter subunit G
MTMILEIVLAALLILGGVFGLVGSYGLIKLKDPMQRLHAPTKATTIGVGTALIAAMGAAFLQTGTLSGHQVLVAIFLFLTAPLSALYLAKTHLHRNIDLTALPDPQTGTPWATLDDHLPD